MDENTVFETDLRSEILKELSELSLPSEKKFYIQGLEGSSRHYLAWLISEALSKKVLYVYHNPEEKKGTKTNLQFFSKSTVSVLPHREIDPKKNILSSSTEKHFERMEFLHHLSQRKVLCCGIFSMFEKLIPKKLFQKHTFPLKVGDERSREETVEFLEKTGYRLSDLVEKKGDYSVRGSILDVYTPSFETPCRIEFFGDEIASIRFFNTVDQVSFKKTKEITLVPNTEIIFTPSSKKQACENILKRAEKLGIGAKKKNSLVDHIKEEIRTPLSEWLLPYFYEETSSVFDYLEDDTFIIIESETNLKEVERSLSRFFEKQKRLAGNLREFFPEFEELYNKTDWVEKQLEKFRVAYLSDLIVKENRAISYRTERMKIPSSEEESPVAQTAKVAKKFTDKGYSTTFVAINETERDKLQNMMKEYGVSQADFVTGELTQGFIFHDLKKVFISENDITVKKKKKRFLSHKHASSAFIRRFSKLKEGDYIVHKEFGVGIFRGMRRMRFKNVEADFIECEYAGGDKVFVPVDKLNMVQRYVGNGHKPRIEKLGSNSWKKKVKSVKKAVDKVARELLFLYAKRKAEKGYPFSPRDQMFKEFEISFPFEETPDQARAIEDVMKDMEKDTPMDRLICGDVGFGKTEVALRAAFKATLDGKQVAFIVPTTLLADQHHRTALARLKDYPVSIEVLSRFKTPKQEKDIFERIEKGTVDIVIGTHKLLSDKVKFKDLGLVIIDEEHKFGVKHKEKLRKMKSGVDVLSLSATPIPRTLQLSLADIRDISIINSPPEGRQPVEVNVCNFDTNLIKEVILEEVRRGGAVFFIHNRIETLYEISGLIESLLPEISIGVTHGRMQQKRLEKTMREFVEGKIDVLVTTAIVESGLDIPRANTIIINDAHTFGMADLYQLKGRVGRGNKKAYAYFLIPSIDSITPEARKRLIKISELSDLGSGFNIAMADLEIRGAGTLFGEEQSGHIADVGLEFYLEMLNGAIKRIKQKEGKKLLLPDPEIKTHKQAYIPQDFVPDSAERLYYYKRISSVATEKELSEIKEELRDRFGNIPPSVENLFQTVKIKLRLKRLGAVQANILRDQAVIVFDRNSPYFKRFAPSGKLRVYYKDSDGYSIIRSKLDSLSNSTRSMQ